MEKIMAEAVRNYPKLANDILEIVGGPTNVRQASRCATRLRLVLKETPGDAKDKISKLPGVITVVESGGQFQVVIGTHVGEVFDAFAAKADITDGGDGAEVKQSIVNRVIATMSAVFAPFIYILAAAGLLQGILIIIRMIWPAFSGSMEDQVFSFISWSPFAFLPILIAITASRHFKVNVFVAVWACAALINPDWSAIANAVGEGEPHRLFGLALSDTVYTSTVLPPLFVVWLLSYMERFLNKYIKGAAQPLVVPLISVVIMVPLTLLAIGPLSATTANGIANAFNWAVDVVPVIAGAIVGGFWQVAVIFGIHWGITPVVLANFDQYGSDTFQAFQTAAVIAQVGAAVGVFLKTRNRQLKSVAGPAAVTGIFGITEPTIYGVTLRLKRPFLLACLSGAAGAVVIALFGSRYYAYAGLPGMLTVVNYYSPDNPASMIGGALGCAIAFFGAALLVYFIGFKDPVEDEDEGAAETSLTEEELAQLAAASIAAYDAALSAATKTSMVAAPVKGRVIDLADVSDEVFASGAMGQGVAILPSEGKVYAPFDGKVVALLGSQHALGLASADGVELLIHVGIDTVELEGSAFTAHVKKGDSVRKGDLLLEFDMDVIKKAGYSLETPVIVTNSKRYSDVLPTPITEASVGEDLLAAVTLPVAADA